MRLNQRLLKWKAWFAFGAILFFSQSFANEVKIDWLEKSASRTYTFAEEFIAADDLPSEKTTLLHDIEIIFDAGEVTRTVRQVNYFPTYNDAHTAGNESIYWDKEVEALTVREARVLKLNGQAHRLNPDNIRVLDSDAYNTFTDQKEVVLPYSGLTDKSISILEYQIKFSIADLESSWSTIIYPVLFDPVKNFRLRVIEDEQTPLTYSSNNKDIIDCKVNDNELECESADLSPNKSDVDIIWRDVLPQIFIGETQTWDDVIANDLKAFEESNNKDDSVQKMLDRIIDDGMTQRQKIEAIHKFVSRDIRYVSMSELGHRITPHTSASVLENRFGDCKDKSAMLHGMLSLIGVDAKPVLVATKRSSLANTRFPSTGYFDHMVICFDSEKQFYCLDPTDSNTDINSISSWIQGMVSLTLEEGAKPLRIPLAPHKWRLNVSSSLEFDENANVVERQERIYHGEYASGIRSSYGPKNDEERNEAATESFHKVVSSLVDPTFEFVGLQEMANTAIIRSEAKYTPFLDPREALNYVENDSWLNRELDDVEISSKHYDARVHGIDVQSTINFDFNKLWNVTWYPPNLNLKGKYGEMTRFVTTTGKHKIQVETRVKITTQMVKQGEIESFNEFLKLLKGESALNFVGETP